MRNRVSSLGAVFVPRSEGKDPVGRRQAPWLIIALAKAFFVFALLVSLAQTVDPESIQSDLASRLETLASQAESRLAAGDAAYYLTLSREGYHAGSDLCAFYPLWPGLIRGATLLSHGSPLLACLLLANGLSLAASCLFYRLVEARLGPALGRDSLVLLLAFPGALFLAFPYSEALFLFLVLFLFLLLSQKRYFWAVVPAFLLPLTRAVGIFVALPLVWYLYESKASRKRWLLLLAPVLGYAAYFCLMRAWTGNAFEGFQAQQAYPRAPSIAKIFDFGGFARAFVQVGSLAGMLDGLLDRVFFVLFLMCLPLIYRLDKTWFWYALPMGLIPALSNQLLSYRRFIIVCFPVFIALAQLLARSRSRWVFWYYVLLLAGLQAWAVKQFVTFNWAG